jgi:biopolymer transport protein ExbD
MIDVVFLLLIFFLFGSFDFAERQVIATLARACSSSSVVDHTIWVRLRRGAQGDLEYAVDDGPFTADDAAVGRSIAARCALASGAVVVVDAAAGVTLQELLDTFALARQAGATEAALRADGGGA